jgi:transposase
MKTMPDINPQSQDVTALQAMVQSLMDKCERLEIEKISLAEQFNWR